MSRKQHQETTVLNLQGWLVGGFKHVRFSISIHFIYGMSSFPLTNSYFSRWWLHHQPDAVILLQIFPPNRGTFMRSPPILPMGWGIFGAFSVSSTWGMSWTNLHLIPRWNPTLYPLVMTNIAMENGGFSQRTKPPFILGMFHGYVSHNQII